MGGSIYFLILLKSSKVKGGPALSYQERRFCIIHFFSFFLVYQVKNRWEECCHRLGKIQVYAKAEVCEGKVGTRRSMEITGGLNKD